MASIEFCIKYPEPLEETHKTPEQETPTRTALAAAPSEALPDENERDEHPEPSAKPSGNGVSDQEKAAKKPNPDDTAS